MSGEASLRIHAIEATGIPKSGSMFGSSAVYLTVKVDDGKFGKSSSVDPTPSAHFNYQCEVRCPAGSRSLVLEVKRGGLLGAASIGGCSLNVATISSMHDQWLPLYSYDSPPSEVGQLRVSIDVLGGQAAPSAPRGLVNRAGTADLSAGGPSFNPPPQATSMGTWGAASDQPPQRSSYSAGQGVPSLVNNSAQKRHSLPAGGGGGLVNYAGANPETSYPSGGLASRTEGPSLRHQGTAGLANLAAEGDDGKRANALGRVRELLDALQTFSPSDEEQRNKLKQALDELRHVPDRDLKAREGRAAFDNCAALVSAVFEHSMVQKDEPGMNGALWLAGRLPASDDIGKETLQDSLRKQWDKVQMDDAMRLATQVLPAAITGSSDSLEKFMDALELAQFHSNVADVDQRGFSRHSDQLMAQLGPPLKNRLQTLANSRNERDAEEAENLLSILGDARVQTLQLQDVQQALERRKGLALLRSALLPLPGQVGFPSLKDRQLRNATLVARSAMNADRSGRTATEIRDSLLKEMLPTCMQHSNESTIAVLRTAFELQLQAHEIWAAAQGPYQHLDAGRKVGLAADFQRHCSRHWKCAVPAWLLSRDQVSCQQELSAALRSPDSNQLQAACKKVLATQGGREVCDHDMRQALSRLQQQYRLPEGWSIESMLGGGAGAGESLLQKVELDSAVLQVFDRLLKETARPGLRTRDRSGAVPSSFTAVKAIEVRNAANWATYDKRRTEIAQQCRDLRVRTDEAFWTSQLNGTAMTAARCGQIAERTAMPPLMKEANEMWLIHGCSTAAADGISSSDFDMARCRPTGLFGAGIYFAESVSKSDEYVQGKRENGMEVFPLLICRVTLGNVNYCDARSPDKRALEASCISDKWHSVLGDRLKLNNTFREFIVYDNFQAFPAYIVYYTRQYPK